MDTVVKEIERLKKEKNAVILAHYYVDGEIQAVADYVGDSYYLSRIASDTTADVIVFCGVQFMGESAKILSPDKKVILPDIKADCPMAHMVTVDKINEMKEKYDDIAVVCYINSTAEIKSVCDVCVTSSNALKIVNALPNKNIFFVPDGNLGRYVATQVTDKNIILNDGYCPIHREITLESLNACKALHPEAKVLVHPECTKDVVDAADYIGATSGIIKYAVENPYDEYIICTENGIIYELSCKCPDKKFYFPNEDQVCTDMKLITLDKLRASLDTLSPEIELSDNLIENAKNALTKMHELAQ